MKPLTWGCPFCDGTTDYRHESDCPMRPKETAVFLTPQEAEIYLDNLLNRRPEPEDEIIAAHTDVLMQYVERTKKEQGE